MPQDYFYPNASPSSVMLRQKILKKCREDIYAWLNHENGQVAIYDAVNPTATGRRALAKEFAKHDVQVSTPSRVFLEVYSGHEGGPDGGQCAADTLDRLSSLSPLWMIRRS